MAGACSNRAKLAGLRQKNQNNADQGNPILPRLPRNVEVKGLSYYYRRQINGKRERVWLSHVADGEHELFKALAQLHKPSARTVADLLHTFLLNSDLKPSTLKGYRIWAKQLTEVFGAMHPHDVTAGHIAQFLELQKKAGKAVTGNRQRAVLSSAYSYGLRAGLVEMTPFTVQIRRNRENPRRRYVRDEEYQDALDRASPHFRDFLEMAYLTGLRQKDLRELTTDSLTRNGIQIEESKTGRRVTVRWSRELRKAVRRAQNRADGPFVLTNTKGAPWTVSALQNNMRRLRVDWTLHDLRAKAESDHKTGLGLLSLYKRDRKITPVR